MSVRLYVQMQLLTFLGDTVSANSVPPAITIFLPSSTVIPKSQELCNRSIGCVSALTMGLLVVFYNGLHKTQRAVSLMRVKDYQAPTLTRLDPRETQLEYFYSLRTSYNAMHFEQIHCPLLSLSQIYFLIFSPPLHLFNHEWSPICPALIPWKGGPVTGARYTYQGSHLKRKPTLPPPEATNCPQLLSWGADNHSYHPLECRGPVVMLSDLSLISFGSLFCSGPPVWELERLGGRVFYLWLAFHRFLFDQL